MDYLKAEQLSYSKWRVLAIPFGGPFQGGKDLDGEFFTARTDIKSDWFRERPVLWHHSKDPVVKDENLGTEDDLTLEDDGWWATVWLDRSNRYWEKVNAMLQAGKVYGSSGALGHLVEKARTGEILVWPHIEQTLTPTPANPFARVVPAKAVDHFSNAGIPEDTYRALLVEPDLGSPTADLPRDLGASVPGDAAATRERVLAATRVVDAKVEAFKNLHR